MFTGATVMMGVASSAKTTLGEALAKRLGVMFVEGVALHAQETSPKRLRGIALTDDDRWPWLARVGASSGAGRLHRILLGTEARLPAAHH